MVIELKRRLSNTLYSVGESDLDPELLDHIAQLMCEIYSSAILNKKSNYGQLTCRGMLTDMVHILYLEYIPASNESTEKWRFDRSQKFCESDSIDDHVRDLTEGTSGWHCVLFTIIKSYVDALYAFATLSATRAHNTDLNPTTSSDKGLSLPERTWRPKFSISDSNMQQNAPERPSMRSWEDAWHAASMALLGLLRATSGDSPLTADATLHYIWDSVDGWPGGWTKQEQQVLKWSFTEYLHDQIQISRRKQNANVIPVDQWGDPGDLRTLISAGMSKISPPKGANKVRLITILSLSDENITEVDIDAPAESPVFTISFYGPGISVWEQVTNLKGTADLEYWDPGQGKWCTQEREDNEPLAIKTRYRALALKLKGLKVPKPWLQGRYGTLLNQQRSQG